MLRDTVIAAVRTGVAAAVGIALTWILNLGVEVPEGFADTLNLVVFGLVVAGYNLLVGLLERNVHPLFGVLLGVPKAPAYGDVGTQTPPPRNPAVGRPRSDRGATDALFLAGIALLILGLVLWFVTVYVEIGMVLAIIGLILIVVGLVRGNSGNLRV
jgi:hypothetical protein